MKKTLVLFAAFSILACLIVLPVIRSVNGSAGNYVTPAPSLVADGDPMPNPAPPASKAGTLVADGDPMPNPAPPASKAGTLVAEGSPMLNPISTGPHFIELTTIA